MPFGGRATNSASLKTSLLNRLVLCLLRARSHGALHCEKTMWRTASVHVWPVRQFVREEKAMRTRLEANEMGGQSEGGQHLFRLLYKERGVGGGGVDGGQKML